MDAFTDYYAVLGVEANAPTNVIKVAFKKLALQYHPDVYKGEDAEERMRVILLAYQTLIDPDERKVYDGHYSEHMPGATTLPRGYVHRDMPQAKKREGGNGTEITPNARRDRQRHYAFTELDASSMRTVHIDLGSVTYDLAPEEVRTLKQDGMLRGFELEATQTSGASGGKAGHTSCYCHRCHHRWTPGGSWDRNVCPSCQARDWGEYLLLRCRHCQAIFESEQIRYNVGSIEYGHGKHCPPYELFPLCPYCGAANWCPAEESRVQT